MQEHYHSVITMNSFINPTVYFGHALALIYRAHSPIMGLGGINYLVVYPPCTQSTTGDY